MQEVLVVVLIALAVFFLPRILGRRPVPRPVIARPVLTGWMRLAIVVTIFWVAGAAFFLKPWQDGSLLFLPIGLGPAAVLWGGVWVWLGYRNSRR